MPNFNVKLSPKTVEKLQPIVDRTNAANDTDYDLVQWLTVNAQEIAIADNLNIANQAITQAEDADRVVRINAATKKARDDLIAALNA